MKLLFIIPYYVPAYSYGGPVKSVHELASTLVKYGNQVTVATTDSFDAQTRNPVLHETIDGVSVIRFRNVSNRLAKSMNVYLPLGFRAWLTTNIKYYDIIHCHDFFTYQNIFTSYFCRKQNKPLLIQPHGCLGKAHIKNKNFLLKKIFLFCFSSIFINADRIVALTKAEQKNLQSHLPDRINPAKIIVIPNGIDIETQNNIKRINLHTKYNLTPSTKLFFFLGRVHPIKGIDYTLRTIQELAARKKSTPFRNDSFDSSGLPDFHFFIVGPDEGGERKRLEKLTSQYRLHDHVTFVGALYGMEKYNFIASCDLMILLSLGEGLPVTVLEAAALEIPSILSKQCHVPEIAQEGGGYEVDKEKYRENAQIIENCLREPKQLERMGVKAKIAAKKNFSIRLTTSKFISVYKTLTSSSGAKKQ
jgi:glycosyltransferase involved in cell wall biosynthesis